METVLLCLLIFLVFIACVAVVVSVYTILVDLKRSAQFWKEQEAVAKANQEEYDEMKRRIRKEQAHDSE